MAMLLGGDDLRLAHPLAGSALGGPWLDPLTPQHTCPTHPDFQGTSRTSHRPSDHFETARVINYGNAFAGV